MRRGRALGEIESGSLSLLIEQDPLTSRQGQQLGQEKKAESLLSGDSGQA
ncbi:MAG: hypothetical protein ACFCU9_07400 [Cyanophyceae cyanobacterium]